MPLKVLRQLRSWNRFLAFYPFLPYAVNRILDSDYAVSERHDAGISSNDDAFTVRYHFEPLQKRPEWIVKQINTYQRLPNSQSITRLLL